MIKKLIYIFFVAFITVAFVRCKNDVKILAPYKDIPVVYGLLDQNDTVHYIRINKAYEGVGNALTMAQQYDSINYPAGTLSVQLQDASQNTTTTLDTTSAIPVSVGVFSYPYQVLYKTSQVLDSTHTYNLIITNKKTGRVVTGSTKLLPDVAITSPPQFMSGVSIDFDPDTAIGTMLQWRSNARAVIYQLTIRFNYYEINTSTNDTTNDYVDFTYAPQTTPSPVSGYTMTYLLLNGPAFLQFLKGSISAVNGRPLVRKAKNVLILFSSGSLDFNTYIQLSQPSLTVNQEKPFFTDLKNAIGIFTARHTQTALKPISPITQNMIDTSTLIRPLNFKP